MPDIAFVMPVLNDWASAAQLVAELDKAPGIAGELQIVLVNDGSSLAPDPADFVLKRSHLHVLHLRANQGHQRAIALGLAHVRRNLDVERIVVMDSDGEDVPAAVPDLLSELDAHPGHIVVAQRGQRSEGPAFRLFYQIYKLLFRCLTGRAISFGNFSAIPGDQLDRVLFNAGIWNNFAATVLKSRAPIRFVEVDRGRRYHGKSSMDLTALMVHGLSAVAVFSDAVVGRLVIALSLLTAGFAGTAATVVILRLATDLFIPGYASTVVLFLASIGLNALFLGFLTLVVLLNGRSSMAVTPDALLDQLVGRVDTWPPSGR